MILAVDHGNSRIGLAVSHGVVAEGLKAIDCSGKSSARIFEEIAELARRQKAKTVVVGLPLGRWGLETEQSRKVREWADQLREATGLSIELVEEAYSTVEARRVAGGIPRSVKRRRGEKGFFDCEAAKIILEQYLNEKRHSPL